MSSPHLRPARVQGQGWCDRRRPGLAHCAAGAQHKRGFRQARCSAGRKLDDGRGALQLVGGLNDMRQGSLADCQRCTSPEILPSKQRRLPGLSGSNIARHGTVACECGVVTHFEELARTTGHAGVLAGQRLG